ncbi:MAG: hypothetical protein AB7E79_03825 [Rhodospirillaceae bacterium]
MPKLFEVLRERLLREGIAPRHVQRYIAELEDHLNELRGQEGSEAAALARLGDAEELVHSMLSRPELRSLGARFPAAIFGAAPVLIWMVAALVMSNTLLLTLKYSIAAQPGAHLASLQAPVNVLVFLIMRVVPVALGIGLMVAALRQRLGLRWPIIGAAAVAMMAGTTLVDITLALTPAETNEYFAWSPLVLLFHPPQSFTLELLGAIAAGLGRSTILLLMMIAPLYIERWRRA